MRQSHSLTGRIAVATLVLAGVVAGTAVVTSELASAADAARRAPRSTHIGVAPDDFVLLDLVDVGTASERFVRVKPDATRETAEFVVPDERVFVATGYHFAGDWQNGKNALVRIWMKNNATDDRLPVLSDALTEESDENGGTRGSLTTGVVFGAGTVLQADSTGTGLLHVYKNTFRALESSSRGYQINVRGYLVDAD